MTARLPTRSRACDECGSEYPYRNARSRYCSNPCRLRAWSRAHPGYMREYSQRADVIARRNEQSRRRYQDDPAPSLAQSRERHESRMRFLTAIKSTCGCVDCGTRAGILHFDHRPGTTKEFAIATGSSRSWINVVAEIEKCDVRCASCHAKRHWAVKRELRAAAA